MDHDACVQAIHTALTNEQQQQQQQDNYNNEKEEPQLLILYDVQYHHAMNRSEQSLRDQHGWNAFVARIPQDCRSRRADKNDNDKKDDLLIMGGLELPQSVTESTAPTTLLYMGDATATNRPYVNAMLRFLTLPPTNRPVRFWSYSPDQNKDVVERSPPSFVSKSLNRRFFLTQKARDASVFGILVGTLSQRHFASAVSALRRLILNANRACYTLAVGKLNQAKLANFAEIECFVLVACPEHSLLENEREQYHVPIITPLELSIALGQQEWGEYYLDYNVFLRRQQCLQEDEEANDHNNKATAEDDDNDNDYDDSPYFSLVTGKYESRQKLTNDDVDNVVDLTGLPGQGQLTQYNSQAAAFLKTRQYRGLETDIGQSVPHQALDGRKGIASDYRPDNNNNNNNN